MKKSRSTCSTFTGNSYLCNGKKNSSGCSDSFEILSIPIAGGQRIDRDTHQLTIENRERFVYQWRATLSQEGNFESVDYKDMRALKTYLLGVSSHLLLRLFLYIETNIFISMTKTTAPYLHDVQGKLPEWSIGPHSKCGDRVTGPGVRIPHFPQE